MQRMGFDFLILNATHSSLSIASPSQRDAIPELDGMIFVWPNFSPRMHTNTQTHTETQHLSFYLVQGKPISKSEDENQVLEERTLSSISQRTMLIHLYICR